MHALLAKVASLLVAPSLFMLGAAGYHVPTIVEFQHIADQKVAQNYPIFGAFNPTGGGTYRLSSSIGTTNASITLTSFKEPVSTIPYTMGYLGSSIEYGTLSPQSSVSEFISFSGITQNSDGSATLTGVLRGLSRTPAGLGCTASTTLAQTHSGQSIFILSDAPCLFSQYYVLQNNATSSGILAFSPTTPPRYSPGVGAQSTGTYNSTTSEFASIAYVNAISIAGVNNATESVKGIVELGTQQEAASSTATGSTAASLVLQSVYASSSPYKPQKGTIPVTNIDGTISSNYISTSTISYMWGGTGIFTSGFVANASSTINATTTLAANIAIGKGLCLNAVCYTAPPLQGGNSSTLTNDGTGNLSWSNAGKRLTNVGASGISISSAGWATSTVQITIPAGTLNASSTIDVYGSGLYNASGTGNTTEIVYIRDSVGHTFASFTLTSIQSMNSAHTFHAIISATSTTASQQTYIVGSGFVINGATIGGSNIDTIGYSGVNFSNALTLTVVIQGTTSGSFGTDTIGNVQYVVNI